MTIRIPVRQYIAVPASDPRGLVVETWELPVAEAAFVELHCWNIGVPGGIPAPDEYYVFMGSRANHDRAARVVSGTIAPAMEAARRAGRAAVHVQPGTIAARHPELRPAARTPSPGPAAGRSLPPASDHSIVRADRVHGPGYRSWAGWDELDVNPALGPLPGDLMIETTDEFQAWCLDRGVTTLVYTGFAANLCLLDSPAATKAMAIRGFRCVVLREGTMAIEFPDQPPDMHTEAALRYLETWVGYTASAADFMAALGA